MATAMDWSPDFCLACDKQTDGRVYCSESCRLAEYEVASSSAGSAASSPSSPRAAFSWPTRSSHTGFHLEPAYNFNNPQPYGTTPSPRTHSFYQSSRPQTSPPQYYTKPVLTPSSSQSSLFSMQSTSSASEPAHLSDESKKALRAYASAFDQSRNNRRQSN